MACQNFVVVRAHHQESKCRTIRESGAPPTVKQARCGAICSILPHKMGSSAAPAVDHIATEQETCQPGAKVTLARRGCGRANSLQQHRAGIQMIEVLRQLSNQLCQSPRAARPPPPATPCTPQAVKPHGWQIPPCRSHDVVNGASLGLLWLIGCRRLLGVIPTAPQLNRALHIPRRGRRTAWRGTCP